MMPDELPQDELRWNLTMLHELLEDVEDDELPPKTREALRLVAQDAHRLLEHDLDEAGWEDLRRRWREAVVTFEAKHPRLTQTLDQVSTILANAGI